MWPCLLPMRSGRVSYPRDNSRITVTVIFFLLFLINEKTRVLDWLLMFRSVRCCAFHLCHLFMLPLTRSNRRLRTPYVCCTVEATCLSFFFFCRFHIGRQSSTKAVCVCVCVCVCISHSRYSKKRVCLFIYRHRKARIPPSPSLKRKEKKKKAVNKHS